MNTRTLATAFGLVFVLVGMSAKGYFQFLAVAYGLLTVLGLLPATQTTFGLVPIWGNDVWHHGLIAVVAGLIGFTTVAESVTARA